MTESEVFALLNEIPDPEIPVISVVELGVVRKIVADQAKIEVTITPTYTGCPAMKRMEDDIKNKLSEAGFKEIIIHMVYSPAWTTDWLSMDAKEKLRKYGIAPPEENTADKNFLLGTPKVVTCPRCKSKNTVLISQFGSTACKALHQCKDCLEPFDYFKCI